VKQLDPSHPRLFVASENESTVGSNVQPFVDTADVLGADFYPISTSDPITAVGDVSRSVQSVTNRYNKQAILVLQAFSWANYPKETWVCPHFPGCARFPTEDELRQMRDLAINNAHLQFILWYSYFDIFRSDHAASHWANLIEAARTIPVVPHLSISHPHFTKVQVLDGQLGLVTI
jgi:hypothetical protein